MTQATERAFATAMVSDLIAENLGKRKEPENRLRSKSVRICSSMILLCPQIFQSIKLIHKKIKT